MNYYGGAENFFSRYLPSIHQRIVNIRMNTYGMNEQQKNAFILGNLPQPWFPKMIDPGSKIYFVYHGFLVGYGDVEETLINYPDGNSKNPRLNSDDDYSLYPFSFKFKEGTFNCLKCGSLPWASWIHIINESGRYPNQRAYIKINNNEDSKIMKLLSNKLICTW